MSAPKPLKAMSLRDSLAKTVRLLTKQGVDVQFRGHMPFVQTRGDKVMRLVLPEINDNAPDELIEALQGYLDHEVGHIFYTPFAKAEKFARGNRVRHSLANIIEDIRLEKLLPRELPGTKENLERMYDNVMDSYFGPTALRANDPGTSKNEAFSCVMVCALRALAGQKAFQAFMDKHNLWPHFMPLIARMPNISRRLRDLETFKDVERLVEDIFEALKPPKPEEGQKKDNADKDQSDEFTGIDPDAAPQHDPDAQDENDDGASDPSPSAEDGETSEGDEDKEDGGEGHGDGKGTDDGEEDEDAGDCSGDADEDGSGDTPADNDLEGDPKSSSKDGRENRSLRDALALLEPAQRRALFLYKKRKQTVAQIAEDLKVTEDETVDLLSQGRRKLRDLLNGG